MKKNTTPPGGIFFCGLEKPCKDQKKYRPQKGGILL